MLAQPKTDYKRKALTLAGGLGGALLVGGLVAARVAKPKAITNILRTYRNIAEKPNAALATTRALEDVIRTPQKFLDSVHNIGMKDLGGSAGRTTYYAGMYQHRPLRLLSEEERRLGFLAAEKGYRGEPFALPEKDLPNVFLAANANSATLTHELTHTLQSATKEKGNVLAKLDFLQELERNSYIDREFASGKEYIEGLPTEKHAYRTAGLLTKYRDYWYGPETGANLRKVANPVTLRIWYPGYRQRFIRSLDKTLAETVRDRILSPEYRVAEKDYMLNTLEDLGLSSVYQKLLRNK